jgi:hypothetical protein
MGRGRLSLVALGVAVAVMLLAAAGAGQASSGSGGKVETQPARTAAYLDLGKERGYQVALYMPTKRIVVFYAFRIERVKRESLGFRYSLYAVRNRGNLERGEVRARFGALGRVDLRFRPSGELRKDDPPSGCEGGWRTSQYGSFVGHLSFRGQGNFFHVSSSKGEAYVARSPRFRCERGQAEEAPPRSLRKYVAPSPLFSDNHSIALLYASGHGHGRHVGITAVHEEGSPPGAEVQLGIAESRPGMAIGHGLYLDGPRGTLLTSLPGAHPATATLAPPAPFFGKAVYSEEDESWSGSLGVRLAGATVPLTGPGFHLHLCVANPLKDRNGCEFFKAEPPADERAARPGWVRR